MRYFSVVSVEVYEQTRQTLDNAWGLPNAVGTTTCLMPAAIANRDANGRILVAVEDEWCEWEPAATLLPDLLANDLVVEISESEFRKVSHPDVL